MRRSLRIAAILAGLALVVGCQPPPPPPPVAPMATTRDQAVGTHHYLFVDVGRSTPPYGDYPGNPWRWIPTTVWYPAVGPAHVVADDLPRDVTHGPYPLVVFAHGYGVTPEYYAPLLQRIASAGYVVVAPTYPILSGLPAGPSDTEGWGDTFIDTRFVTTTVLDLGAGGDALLGGMVDPQRIAVAGHSDGGLISFGDGFEALRTDSRVRAVISFAAQLGEPGTIYQPNGRPFLHFVSDHDPYNDFDATLAWDHANLGAPSWTVALWNADHAPPYVDPADPHFDLVVRTTVDFLDAALKAQSASSFLVDVIARPDLAAFR